MAQQITITASSEKELQQRHQAMSTLNQLPTKVIERLATLSSNPKARSYFEGDLKFMTVKSFLKI